MPIVSVTMGQSADDESLVLGKLLYKIGDYERGIPSCQVYYAAMVLVIFSGLPSSWRAAQRILN